MESRKQSTDDDDTTPEGTTNDKTPTDDDIELEEADDSCSAETDNECKSRSPPCQFCSTAGLVLPAEVLCENCGYQYCYECLNILHPRRGPFTTHRLQSVNRKCEVPVKVFLCPHHEEANPKQVQVYCVSCSSAVCFECTTIKGRHQNHFLRLFKEQAAVGMVRQTRYDWNILCVFLSSAPRFAWTTKNILCRKLQNLLPQATGIFGLTKNNNKVLPQSSLPLQTSFLSKMPDVANVAKGHNFPCRGRFITFFV